MDLERFKDIEHSESLTDAQEALSLQLFGIGAIKFGEFRLKLHEKFPEAPLSPVYLDLRVLRRYPEVKETAVNAYIKLLKPLQFDLIADVPTGATPLVSSISDKLGIGMITPRTDSKEYGTGLKIDGMMEEDKGKTVVLIDDVITLADSKFPAITLLKENGLAVRDVVVLVDREQGGRQQIKKAGLSLYSALTISEIIYFCSGRGLISSIERKRILKGLGKLNRFLYLRL